MMLLLIWTAAGCGSDRATSGSEPTLRYLEDSAAGAAGVVELGPMHAFEGGRPASIKVWVGRVDPVGDVCKHPEGLVDVLGTLSQDADRVIFEPRFEFTPGLEYTACAEVFATGSERASVLGIHFTPWSADDVAVPRIVAVWPPSGEVPANLLRVYVTFSEPMQTTAVAQHVELVDDQGLPVVDAFVDVPNGLWDHTAKRLTLFVHPGRIKRGVGPGEVMGAVLTPGRSVTLRVQAGLESSLGSPLQSAYEHTWSVGPADRTSPAPSQWRLNKPSRPRDPVIVRFGERLDPHQLMRFVSVAAIDGVPVVGRHDVAVDGLSWSLTPEDPWPQGDYQVVVHPSVEDLAGNSVQRLFDTALDNLSPADGPASASGQEPVVLKFSIR